MNKKTTTKEGKSIKKKENDLIFETSEKKSIFSILYGYEFLYPYCKNSIRGKELQQPHYKYPIHSYRTV